MLHNYINLAFGYNEQFYRNIVKDYTEGLRISSQFTYHKFISYLIMLYQQKR